VVDEVSLKIADTQRSSVTSKNWRTYHERSDVMTKEKHA